MVVSFILRCLWRVGRGVEEGRPKESRWVLQPVRTNLLCTLPCPPPRARSPALMRWAGRAFASSIVCLAGNADAANCCKTGCSLPGCTQW